MKRYDIKMIDGTTKKVNGTKFIYRIKDRDFEFVYHKTGNLWVLTHLKSGARVAYIDAHSISSNSDNVKDAAVQILDVFISKQGADRVYRILSQAEQS